MWQKTQLKLQDVEMQVVQVSLQEEQRRFRLLREDRETVVNQLQVQIQQLQKERNDYYSKMQELQVSTELWGICNLYGFIKYYTICDVCDKCKCSAWRHL